jgi:TonB-linked SusC/RagA family outer membrane protein
MSKKITLSTGVLLAIVVLPLFSLAQKNISGHVLSKNDHSPVPGVSVVLKGTHYGTSTGVDGSFVLKAKEGDVLEVTGVGVQRAEQVVNGNDLNISVSANEGELTQIVVTATGIKKEAKRLGYAIQTVDAAQLTKAREPDPINSLKGNVAGLQVNINSEIGHPSDVTIRGENGDRPLFVVDGVPINSDTYNINADDIETFTILKGPNAAALYGFQGKSGAIIINTKGAAKNKPLLVTINSSTQFNTGFIALPKYQDTYGPGDNGKYAYAGGGSSPQSYFGSGAVGSGNNDYDYDVWGPQFRGQAIPQYDGTFDPTKNYTTTYADGSTWAGHVAPTPWIARGKDNLKKFIQSGLLSSNSVSLSSSTEKTDFRLSLGNVYQQGIVPNTQLNNFNATVNVTQRLDKNLSATLYFNYSRQSTPNVPDVAYGPNSIIYNIIIWGGADWAMSDMRNYWQPGFKGIQQKYEEYYRYNNPYFMSYEWLRGHYQNNEYGYISLNYKPSTSLEFQLRPSIAAYDMFNSEKLPYSADVYGRELRQGDYREDRRALFESIVDLQARYHRNQIAGFLDVSAVAGGTVRNFNFNSGFESTNYLNTPGIYNFSNSQGSLTGSNFNSSMLVLSAYGSLDLGYKSYVTANVTGRVDKSSSLPSNTNSYFYPSINMASVISEYVKLPEVISFLKVRASYATTKDGGTTPYFSPNISGTPAAGYGYTWYSPYNGPTYQFVQTYSQSPTYSSQTSAVFTTQTIDPNISTAQRKATEVGLDIRFLHNRLGLDVTRFHYWNKQIIGQLTSASSGYGSYLTNGDVYTNDGWEATLSGTPIQHPDGFTWNIMANFSNYQKKWVTYNSHPDNYEKNGARVDLVYGNAFVRTPDNKMVIDPGSGVYLRYSDVGSSAQKVFGHADPDWIWGLVNTFSYKNLSFKFQFDGMVGGVVEDYVRKKTLQGGRHSESAEGALGAARPMDEANIAAYTANGVILSGAPIQLDPINGNITNYKSLTPSTNTVKSQVQPFVTREASIPDLDIVNKTYVKLREVAITYKIPQKLFGRKNIVSGASISAVGRNLLYFFPDKFKDLDVDQYTQDKGSGLQTPTTRSFGFNLNISF